MHGHFLILQNIDMMRDIIKGGVMLEVGSDRESGSTALLARAARDLGMHFVTVDPDPGANERSRRALAAIDDSFEAVSALGEEYIRDYSGEFSLVYLDAFDNVLPNWPHKPTTVKTYADRGVDITNENSWNMHLSAAEGLVDKMVSKGFVCFDDTVMVGPEWHGKGKLAMPFLLRSGFDIVDNDYNNCILLQKEG